MSVAVANFGERTYLAAEALAEHRRVRLDSTPSLVYSDAGEDWIGTTSDQVANAGYVAVIPASEAGTRLMVASAAITAGVAVYGAADGKVSSTQVGRKIGTALQAASGDGSVIEVLVGHGEDRGHAKVVEAKTGNYTVLAADSGKCFTTVGAGATVTFAMPAAVVGMEYWFRVGAAQELRIDPNGTETISLPSTGAPGAAGKYLTANADGETVHVVCTKAGEWNVFGFTGTWTAEA